MAAIITEEFRRENAKLLYNDIVDPGSSNYYYIGIGQQRPWPETLDGSLPPFPAGTANDEDRVKQSLTGLFKVENTSYMIPKVILDVDKEYKVYNPFDPTCFYGDTEAEIDPCYGVYEGNIFLCIYKNPASGALGSIDSFKAETNPQFTDKLRVGGYTWVWLGSYDVNNQINSNEFIAVNSIADIQDTGPAYATGGLIHGFEIIYGGEGYGGTETLISGTYENVTGHIQGIYNGNDTDPGSGDEGDLRTDTIDVDITITDGVITNIEINDITANTFPTIRWYSEASIEFPNLPEEINSPTSVAHIIPHVAPSAGFGENKLDTLPSWYVGIYTDTGQADYIPDGSGYHQISVIKNPLTMNPSGTAKFTAEYVQPLNYFTLPDSFLISEDYNPVTGPAEGWEITQGIATETVPPVGDNYFVNNHRAGKISHVQLVESKQTTELLPVPRFYYYGDYYSGLKQITTTPADGNITFINPDPGGAATIETNLVPDFVSTSNVNNTYRPNSGTVVFQDNRSIINRSTDQNEELKVIIQL